MYHFVYNREVTEHGLRIRASSQLHLLWQRKHYPVYNF